MKCQFCNKEYEWLYYTIQNEECCEKCCKDKTIAGIEHEVTR
jgi:hypothetical protein